jgi:hypothetical protein
VTINPGDAHLAVDANGLVVAPSAVFMAFCDPKLYEFVRHPENT